MYVYLALVSICMYNKEKFCCLTKFLFPSKFLEDFAKEKFVDLKHRIGTDIFVWRFLDIPLELLKSCIRHCSKLL